MSGGHFLYFRVWESACRKPSVTAAWGFPDEFPQLALEGVKAEQIPNEALALNLPGPQASGTGIYFKFLSLDQSNAFQKVPICLACLFLHHTCFPSDHFSRLSLQGERKHLMSAHSIRDVGEPFFLYYSCRKSGRFSCRKFFYRKNSCRKDRKTRAKQCAVMWERATNQKTRVFWAELLEGVATSHRPSVMLLLIYGFSRQQYVCLCSCWSKQYSGYILLYPQPILGVLLLLTHCRSSRSTRASQHM